MRPMQLVIVSGRSGAGKTTAAHALEDLGFFVVDNLPPQLLDELLNLTESSKGGCRKVALVIDVRETEYLPLLPQIWQALDDQKYIKKLIYLDAREEKLISRYQETKRRHPLDDGCGIRPALEAEENMLKPVKDLATKIMLTDHFNSHELSQAIKKEVVNDGEFAFNVTFMSFGYKYGVPSELDLCFDVRFIKNPYYDANLRPKSGLDPQVRDFILGFVAAQTFLAKVTDLIDFLLPQYEEEGKQNLTIAFGCTGGRHRSVAMVETLAKAFSGKITKLRVEHRDLDVQN